MYPQPRPEVERHRLTKGPLRSTAAFGNNGVFIIPGPERAKLCCIISDNTEWQPIEDFEDLYYVSNKGDVLALAKEVRMPNGATRHHAATLLAKENASKGYLRVSLIRNRVMKKVMVHVLVAKAFIPNPHGYPIVNHIDGNRTNNVVSNLEWCTYAYNTHHAIENGLRSGKTLAEIESIKEMFASGMPLEDVATQIGLTPRGAKAYQNGYYRDAPTDLPSRYPGGHLWDHVSISVMKKPDRCPTWAEMCFVKDLFWPQYEAVVQIHPAKSEYVTFHDWTLHLWRPQELELPLPPHTMVGPQSVEEGMGLLKGIWA